MTNEELNAKINELWAATKRGDLPRQARFAAIEQLTEEYIEATGRRPDPAMLDRLATLCLYEEVTDDTPYKIQNTEYPIMGDRMFEERKARNVKESTINTEQERTLTGSRRKRSPYEHAYIDRHAKIRNTERRKKYREFTKVQPVITYFR